MDFNEALEEIVAILVEEGFDEDAAYILAKTILNRIEY